MQSIRLPQRRLRNRPLQSQRHPSRLLLQRHHQRRNRRRLLKRPNALHNPRRQSHHRPCAAVELQHNEQSQRDLRVAYRGISLEQ